MKAQLSSKDLIQISAYLDGELSERERLNFEKRLEKEDSLKSALQDMRFTKQLIRTLPSKKAPYNFTITQSMAESLSNPFKQLIRVFSFSSAASFLVAVVLLIMNLAPNLMPMSSAAAPVAYDMATEIQEKAVEEGAAEPEIILWSEPQAFGKGGGQEEPMPLMAAPADVMEEAVILPTEQTETTATMQNDAEAGVFESEVIEEESVMAEAEVPEESEAAAGAEMMQQADAAETQTEESAQSREMQPTPAATSGVIMPTAESFNPILGLPSGETQETNQLTVSSTLNDTERGEKETNWFLISEIGLIMITMVSAALAIWLSKKS